MTRWNIYYLSREYAREHGDPLLGVVEAETKEEAERKANVSGLGGVAGCWATTTLLLPGERIAFAHTERGIAYRDVGVYKCAKGHQFESSEGRLSPFEPKVCPICMCSSRLLHVYEAAVGMNP